jgi:hypothetical protein
VLRNWTYLAAIATLLVITVLSGLVHGYLDGRWAAGPDLAAAAARLPELPEKVGPWVLVSDQELPANAARILQCYGSVVREYWNPATGDRVNVALLFGPRGPIAVHTPEICYSSAGTTLLGDRVAQSLDIDGQSEKFWSVQFAHDGDPKPSLEVWYAWSDGGPWQAADQPRFWLTDRLYKIQLAGKPSADGTQSSLQDFLAHFLLSVREAIQPT